MLSYDQALQKLIQLAHSTLPSRSELVPVTEAVSRISAQDIHSPIDVPAFRNSAMDGYGVALKDVALGATLPVSMRIPAGICDPCQVLLPGTCAQIFTGAAVPDGVDAIVMQEDVVTCADGVQFPQTPKLGQHIREVGSDILKEAILVQKGERMSPAQVGLLASAGIAQVPVRTRLKVALVLTGDELIQPGQALPFGGVYNANHVMLLSLLRQLDVDVFDLGTLPDDYDVTRSCFLDASKKFDVLVTAGGVSVGGEDHVKAVINELGLLQLWKVSIKPGKPMAIGRIGECDVIGLPGNPVSAFVTFLTLARTYFLARMGAKNLSLPHYFLPAAFNWNKTDERVEFLRARISSDQRVEIYHDQKSGVLSSAAWGHGLVKIDVAQNVIEGDWVTFIPYLNS